MRIGMFTDMYKPHISGVTNSIALTKRQLERLGHEVFVFTFGNESYRDDEPNVFRSPAIPWGKTGWQAGVSLSKEARHLARTLDIAHTHHPFASARIAIHECVSRGIPVVFTNHTRYDIYSDAYARFAPRRMRMAFLKNYLNDLAEDVSMVIAPSPGIVDWLRDFGVTDRAVLIPNGIDTEPFAHPARPHARTEFGWTPENVIFCYLGRLGPEKNLGTLIDAFVTLAAHDPRPVLLLLGEGPARGLAQEKLWAHGLSDRVHFAGQTPYEAVPDLLGAADVFVTASVSEVHPLVLIEAMAAGLPPVGIRSPGIADMIDDGITGLLAEESADDLAAHMALIAGDRSLRTTMSAAASVKAKEYDIRRTVDVLLSHYHGLLETRVAV